MKKMLVALVLLCAAPVAAAPPARAVKLATPAYSFEYAYPAAAGAIPRLRALLDADLARQLAKLKRQAAQAQVEARRDKFPYHAWYYNQTWQVVTDLPGWLSLSASFANYSGGAHGMAWFGSMLFDKQAQRARDPLTLFTTKEALSRAIRGPFCDALDKQRAERRQARVNRASGDEFDKCIDPVGETVILGSRGKRGFDRIGILVPPYEAGPYAEGTYEVTVPVTPAVIAAARPEFRAAFTVTR